MDQIGKVPNLNDLKPATNSNYKPIDGSKKEERKELQKVVKSTVTTKKPSFGKKFANMFISEDVDNVKDYIFRDVLIPALKDTITDALTKSIEMILYGKVRSNGKNKSGTYVSYNSYSSGTQASRDYAKPVLTRQFDDIIFESRADASDVLGTLIDVIESYGSVSIADLKDLVGLDHGTYTDQYYGWTNLGAAQIMRERGGGWSIKFPRPIDLK